MKTNSSPKATLHSPVLKLSRLHFLYAGLLIVQIVAYDAWKLITPTSVKQRWLITSLLLVVDAAVWYLAKTKPRSNKVYKLMIWALISADILVASLYVYTQRGMASRAVALFAIPIVVSAVLHSRAAVLATSTICAASYTTAAVLYFVNYFNEGYKIELYGEIGFYSATMFILAAFLSLFLSSRRQT